VRLSTATYLGTKSRTFVIGGRFEERNQTDLADGWPKELITVFDPEQIAVLFCISARKTAGWSLNTPLGVRKK